MLRVLVSPASDASSRGSARTISAEWAEGAAERLRETRVPELPAVDLGCSIRALRMDQPAPSKSELSMYTQLMRANLQAAKEAERSAKDALMSEDAGRVRQSPPASPGSNRVRKSRRRRKRRGRRLGCRRRVRLGGGTRRRARAMQGRASGRCPGRHANRLQARRLQAVHAEESIRRPRGFHEDGVGPVHRGPDQGPDQPGNTAAGPPAGDKGRGVGSGRGELRGGVASSAVQAHATVRPVGGASRGSRVVSRRLETREWSRHLGRRRRLYRGGPLGVDEVGARGAARGGRTQPARRGRGGERRRRRRRRARRPAGEGYATDDPRSAASRARAAREHARALRTYVGGALRRHPAALANVRACLAAAFLRLPLARVPPLVRAHFWTAPRCERVRLPNPARVPAGSRGPAVGPDGARPGGVSADPRRRAVVARRPRRRSRLPRGRRRRRVRRGDGGSFGLGGIALPPGAPAAWAAAAAGAAADLGKPRKPEDIVAAVLPPTAGTLDALIGATLVSLSLSAISPEGGFSDRGFSVKDARRLAARLATHALASAPRAPRASGGQTLRRDRRRTGHDGRRPRGGRIHRRGTRRGQEELLSDDPRSTPLGPALAKALIPREARCEFAIKVIVHAAAPSAGLLAVAAGWAVASLDEDAASRLWERGFGSVAGAGWINDGSPSPGMRTTVPLPGRGWYRDAAEGIGPTDDGAAGDPRVKPRLELCLLAFHRMGRRKRMAALADALETVAGSIPGGGATSRVARSHAAFLCAHCVRNFRETPRWLVARVQRTMRGKRQKTKRAAAPRLVDALLASLGDGAASPFTKIPVNRDAGKGGEGGSSSAPRRSRPSARLPLVLAARRADPEAI